MRSLVQCFFLLCIDRLEFVCCVCPFAASFFVVSVGVWAARISAGAMRRAILMDVKHVCKLFSSHIFHIIHSFALSVRMSSCCYYEHYVKYLGVVFIVWFRHQIVRQIYCQSSVIFLLGYLYLSLFIFLSPNRKPHWWKAKCAHILFTFQWLCVIAYDIHIAKYKYILRLSMPVSPLRSTEIWIALTLHANTWKRPVWRFSVSRSLNRQCRVRLYDEQWLAHSSTHLYHTVHIIKC